MVAAVCLPFAVVGVAATGSWSAFGIGSPHPPAAVQEAAVVPGASPSVRWLVGAAELGPQWYEGLREVNAEVGWVMVVLRSSNSRYAALGQQVFLLPDAGGARVALDAVVADELANRSAVAGVSGGTAREISAPAPARRAVRRTTSTLDVLSLYAARGRYLVIVEVQDVVGAPTAPSTSRAERGLAAVLARVPA
jgi:hypothetical protein